MGQEEALAAVVRDCGAPAAVVRDYGSRAREYAELLGDVEHLAAPDVELVLDWAHGLSQAASAATVLDVGCGPGQWTRLLTKAGVAARGIDPVPEFVELARARYPQQRFDLASAQATGAAEGTVDGVLNWYSLIHAEPSEVRESLAEFHRILRPGGGLAVGFFEGPVREPFAHAVTTAYFWPMEELSREVAAAGFTVIHTEERSDPGSRRHGALIATRNALR